MFSLTLLCLAGFIIAETSGSFCHDSGVSSNIQVATFCRPSYATGSSVIVDGYVAFESVNDTSCLCTASITIPGGATSTVAFSAFFGLQPGYAGCGSSINLKHLDENIRIACSILGSVTTSHNDTVDIQLVKEAKPMDTRYCMKLQMSDSSATVSVSCSGGGPIEQTTSTRTSPQTGIPTSESGSTSLPASTGTFEKSSFFLSTLSKFQSTNIETTLFNDLSTIATKTTENGQTPSTDISKLFTTDLQKLLTSQVTDIEDEVELISSPKTSVETTNSKASAPIMISQSITTQKSTEPIETSTQTSFQLTTKEQTTALNYFNTTAQTTAIKTTTEDKSTEQTTASNEADTTPETMTTRQTTEMRTSTRADKIETPTLNVIKTTMAREVVTSDSSILSASTDAVTTEKQKYTTTSVTNVMKTTQKETYTSEADKEISTTLHEVTSKFTTMLGESSSTRTSEQPQSSSSSTIPTVKKPPDSQKSDDIPVEVIAPVASVAGIILICVIICIAVGIRRKNSGNRYSFSGA